MISCYSFFFSSHFPLQISVSLMPVFPASFLQYVQTLAPAVLFFGKTSAQLVSIKGNVVWWAQKDPTAASSSLVSGQHCCWPAGRGHCVISGSALGCGGTDVCCSGTRALPSFGKSFHSSIQFSPCVQQGRGQSLSCVLFSRQQNGLGTKPAEKGSLLFWTLFFRVLGRENKA